MPATACDVTMTCSICKTPSNPDGHQAVWVCLSCVRSETQNGEEWIAMVRRFFGGNPRQGESFSVVRHVLEDQGMFFALESIGSTYVAARLSIAKKCDTEGQALQALRV